MNNTGCGARAAGSLADLPECKEIPLQGARSGSRAACGRDHGRVDNLKDVIEARSLLGNVKGLIQLGHGTDTEDVDGGGYEEPERPGPYASVRWDGLLGLGLIFRPGLVLADGRGVHLSVHVCRVCQSPDAPDVKVLVEAGLQRGTVVGAGDERVVGVTGKVVGPRVTGKFQHRPDAQKINEGKEYEEPGDQAKAAVFWIRRLGFGSCLFFSLFSHWKSVAHKDECGKLLETVFGHCRLGSPG